MEAFAPSDRQLEAFPRLGAALGAAASVAFLLVGAGVALADTLQMVSSRDNTLYEDAEGDVSNGAGSYFFTGNTEQPDAVNTRRGLLYFDVAGNLPAGATVTAVSLRLYMSRASDAAPHATGLHRALADWGEGTSDASGGEGAGAPATPGDATWLHTYFDTQTWTAAGGDFDPAPTAVALVGEQGLYVTWSDPAMVAEIQSWLDEPAGNHGWLVLGDESTIGTSKRFSTREDSEAGGAYRPLLTVQFMPAGDTIFVDGFETGDGCQWSLIIGLPPC
jgi:hypothetical protein